MWRRLIPVLLVVALLVAACGDDESVFTQGTVTTVAPTTVAPTTTGGETTTTAAATTTTTEAASTTLAGDSQAMADQIAGGLLSQAAADGPIDEESAQCLGEGVVGAIGTERLQELGVRPDGIDDPEAIFGQMTEGELTTVTDVVLGCIDVRGLITDQLAAGGISQGSADCVADGFLEGPILQDFILAALANPGGESEMDPDVASQLLTVLMGCLTPEELANLGNVDLGG